MKLRYTKHCYYTVCARADALAALSDVLEDEQTQNAVHGVVSGLYDVAGMIDDGEPIDPDWYARLDRRAKRLEAGLPSLAS